MADSKLIPPPARSARAVLVGLLLVMTGCEFLRSVQVANIGADYWRPKVDGVVDVNAGGVIGTNVDLEQDLRLDDEEPVLHYHGTLLVGPSRIDLRYLDLEFEGDGPLPRDVTYAGESFSAGETIASSLDLSLLTAHLVFPIAQGGPLDLGALLGVNRIDTRVKMVANSRAAADDVEGFFPVVGLTGAYNMPLGERFKMFIAAEGSGVVVPGWGLYGRYLDLNARVGISYEVLSIGIGYRRLDIDLGEHNEVESDFTLSGPFLFGELAF
ncbi:MAG: hypothetical protein ACKVX7_11855 [Planctomycetota bacterium]